MTSTPHHLSDREQLGETLGFGGMSEVPVMLPPGSLKERMRPSPTGSGTATNTSGTSGVSACAFFAFAGVPHTHTSGPSAANSAEYCSDSVVRPAV